MATLRLKDDSFVAADALKPAIRTWKQLTVMSQSSADALGAIVDLVAHVTPKGPNQPDTEFSQASVDILRGFGWWPLTQHVEALVRNAVHLDPERGVYVWDNPVKPEPVNGH